MAARVPEHVYVYYRLAGDAGAAHAAVARLFAEVEARTGVAGRLLERREASRTWLEVYEPVSAPAAFLRVLAAAVRRQRAADHAVDGRRVIERFAAATSR